MPIGCAVTLRGARMYEFLDRFITPAVPRMRDFRGLPNKSFDGRGNYTFGIKEQMIFPEIDYDKVEKIHGMDITIVTTAGRDDLGHGAAAGIRLAVPRRDAATLLACGLSGWQVQLASSDDCTRESAEGRQRHEHD